MVERERAIPDAPAWAQRYRALVAAALPAYRLLRLLAPGARATAALGKVLGEE